jgi:hypothetical protein
LLDFGSCRRLRLGRGFDQTRRRRSFLRQRQLSRLVCVWQAGCGGGSSSIFVSSFGITTGAGSAGVGIKSSTSSGLAFSGVALVGTGAEGSIASTTTSIGMVIVPWLDNAAAAPAARSRSSSKRSLKPKKTSVWSVTDTISATRSHSRILGEKSIGRSPTLGADARGVASPFRSRE